MLVLKLRTALPVVSNAATFGPLGPRSQHSHNRYNNSAAHLHQLVHTWGKLRDIWSLHLDGYVLLATVLQRGPSRPQLKGGGFANFRGSDDCQRAWIMDA